MSLPSCTIYDTNTLCVSVQSRSFESHLYHSFWKDIKNKSERWAVRRCHAWSLFQSRRTCGSTCDLKTTTAYREVKWFMQILTCLSTFYVDRNQFSERIFRWKHTTKKENGTLDFPKRKKMLKRKCRPRETVKINFCYDMYFHRTLADIRCKSLFKTWKRIWHISLHFSGPTMWNVYLRDISWEFSWKFSDRRWYLKALISKRTKLLHFSKVWIMRTTVVLGRFIRWFYGVLFWNWNIATQWSYDFNIDV